MEAGRLTKDAKSFVSILFQLGDDVVEIEIIVVFGDRLFGIVEFVVIHRFLRVADYWVSLQVGP
jgi:hypothetical protein